jgi:hypothetical protein
MKVIHELVNSLQNVHVVLLVDVDEDVDVVVDVLVVAK